MYVWPNTLLLIKISLKILIQFFSLHIVHNNIQMSHVSMYFPVVPNLGLLDKNFKKKQSNILELGITLKKKKCIHKMYKNIHKVIRLH